MTTTTAKTLRVVVADDHHHVLPAIHLAIRRRVLPFADIHVLHFDAHPDLSFPRAVDPALVFDPEQLYDALDESISGIAEFLLPLVYAGHVSQVTWIKPHWAQQMPIQAMKHAFVGKHADALCVSLPLAHFIEEDSFAPAEAMDEKSLRRWDLFVAELPHGKSSAESGVLHDAMVQLRKSAKAYVLDIDLDYFSTWNPFRKDLEQRVGSSISGVVARVFCGLRYKNMQNGMGVSARVHDRRAFVAAMERLQRDELYLDPESAACQALLATVLLRLYPDGAEDATQQLFGEFFRLLTELDDEVRKLVWWAGSNMDLPHHLSSEDEIERMAGAFQDFLVANDCQRAPPSLVTIAKSIGDEYLPPHQAEFVLSRVLRVLTEVFGQLAVEYVEYEKVNDGENADAK